MLNFYYYCSYDFYCSLLILIVQVLQQKLKPALKFHFRTGQYLSQSMMKIGLESMFPNSQAPVIPGRHTGLFLRMFPLNYYCLFIIKVNHDFIPFL